ncbi:tetratricopeptide repeat protein [Nonomuraea angiospora]|uniref:Cytochrome c-type biogenesis protein CcmH/NrfG n=1 Tax=Nonomuraea angiospora TaxID=46172 RepID=A0ABR9M6F7_9ACTN|nr:tetratricopeptide repeat protein [Nonomuraea angiospora]MBE1588502.1 cytochrome c-type biogenesis protein CcmH/NrfG [Nonomuraea angiospora]
MNPRESVLRAGTLLQMRRPADAERELRGVLAVQPEHFTAFSLLGLALVQQGRTAEAVSAAQEAVRLAPDQSYPHYMAGQVYLRVQRPDLAVTAAETSLAHNPESASTWELLARAHLRLGRYREVVEAARRGLAIDPQESDLVSLLAMAHVQLGEAEQARAAAANAVRLDPESETAHLAYGHAALAAGDAKTAAAAFREVLRLDPGFDPARDLLVTALKQRNPLYRVLSNLRGRFLGGWRMVLLLPAVPPLIAVFVLIAVLHWAAWVAEAVTVLRLARAKATRLLFEGVEARVALASCALLAAGVGVLALGIALGQDALGTAGAAVMALVTPVQEAAHTGSARGRRVLYGWTGLLVVAIVASVALGSTGVALLAVYAGIGTIWVAAGVRRLSPAPERPPAG